MTPGPITAAAARTKPGSAEPAEKRARARGLRLRKASGPRPARRISGPVTRRESTARGAPAAFADGASGSTGAALAARAEAVPRPASRPRPRPTVAPRPTPAPRRARTSGPQPLGARVAGAVRSLPDHALLDRLVRGRAWIPLLGVLLAGIVAMQVAVLKMSETIGRSLATSSQLQVRNEQLRTAIASLADAQRIQRLGAQMGMVTAHPDMVGFLSPLPGGAIPQAIRSIHTPDGTNFLYSAANYGTPPSNGTVVTLSGLQQALTGNLGTGSAALVGAAGTAGGTAGTSPSSPATNAGTVSQTAQAGAPSGVTGQSGGGGAPAGAPSIGPPAGTGGGTPGGGTPSGTQGGGAQGGGPQGGGAQGGGTQGGGTQGGGATGGASLGQTGTQTPGG